MLDNITKKNIDDCRDVLVGKVPDPKSQIEQITIALIYKFMDDMDKEAVEKFKGKPNFSLRLKKRATRRLTKNRLTTPNTVGENCSTQVGRQRNAGALQRGIRQTANQSQTYRNCSETFLRMLTCLTATQAR
jgi:hypothetical protein